MTLLKERFVYTKIDRATTEGRRLYALPDGSKVPSVTTILDKTKPREKPEALLAWKRRVGEPGTNPYSVQSHMMAKHIIEHGLKNVDEVWGVEVPLYYPGLYAGTTDCVGVHLREDAIMDH